MNIKFGNLREQRVARSATGQSGRKRAITALLWMLACGSSSTFAQVELFEVASGVSQGPKGAVTNTHSSSAQTSVKLNTDAMHSMAAGDIASVKTPSGTQYRITYQRKENGYDGGRVWVGYLTDYGASYPVIISTYQGQVSGTINTPNGKHRLLGSEQSATLTDEIAANEPIFIPTANDGLPAPFDPAALLRQPSDVNRPANNSTADVVPAATSAANSQIDIMVLYTQGFATTLGSNALAIARVNQVVATANTVYLNSGIHITLVTAYSGAIAYPDNDSVPATTALNDITGYSSPRYDTTVATTVANLRSQYGADLVSLLRVFKTTPSDGTCGIAWITNPSAGSYQANYAFAVEDDIRTSGAAACDGAGTTAGDTGFTHELGHNMGAIHDRATDGANPETGYPSYNRGYCNGGAGTLMSYSSSPGCNPIQPYFSSPALNTCNSASCGVASNQTFTAFNTSYTAVGADSVTALNINAPYLAAYVASVAPGTTNWAAASNGATATASSSYNSSFAPSATIDGDRKGTGWGSGGGWNDATAGAFPDWVQINFSAAHSINNVTVYTLQDNFSNPIEPTDTMTFSQYGLTAFDVQVLIGSTWTTVASVSGNNYVKRNVNFAAVTTSAIRILCNNGLAGFSRMTEVEARYIDDWAAASNGATATASSSINSSFPPSSTIDGDRKGTNWGNGGGWNDATASTFPDWLQINFNVAHTINNVTVYTLQDNYSNPIEPTDTTTFSQYGLTAFDVQVLIGSTWTTVASVSGNNKVKRSVYFAAVTTGAIRIVCNNALAGFSRITEVEARYATNWAAAGNGATATASSSYNASFSPSSTIDGDRKGTRWGNGGGWNDATAGAFPDWLEIDFNATRTINNVTVYTLKDNYSNPIEPTDTTTFSQYGVTAFDVQVLNGSTWTTVASVSGNNNVRRSVNFTAVTTSAIRIVCNSALAGFSRITEVEASGN